MSLSDLENGVDGQLLTKVRKQEKIQIRDTRCRARF